MRSQSQFAEAESRLETPLGPITYHSLELLEKIDLVKLDRIPFSIRILIENILRNVDGHLVTDEDVGTSALWTPQSPPDRAIPFMPSRVLTQDFTGVPAVVDLAAMRSAMVRMGGDPERINPVIPVDLVIDHSVQVDYFGNSSAFTRNVELEFKRNKERYSLLRWGQKAFDNFQVVPPGTGIVHQVNLEYLASVITVRNGIGFPDTLVGTDSHTTMINGLGVLGWGVGGIEAEAVLLGQPYFMLMPEVVGLKLTGALQEGVTATDLVLMITQMLRHKGVVGKFVEFYGPGLSKLATADRATIANMAPEYGATVGFSPIDQETLNYLLATGRDPSHVDIVERYAKAQGLFRTDHTPDPDYTDRVELDMSTVEPSLAGPRRPQDRVTLETIKDSFWTAFNDQANLSDQKAKLDVKGEAITLEHGSVVIAAITSCTNTSNPSVMIGAGLLARNAVERGLRTKPWVKPSMAPGSRVVTQYLDGSGLTPYLEALDFYTVGYGCTTCIGNSGPLLPSVSAIVNDHDLIVAAVLSGNRNFEGRIHSQVKANYLASPMLVVAYALAGRVDIDLTKDPIGHDTNGQPVYLQELWPSQEQIHKTVTAALKPEMFKEQYSNVFEGDEQWKSLPLPEGAMYEWDPESTYIQEPPFFQNLPLDPPSLQDIRGARVLALLGNSVTTDHISPAGAISSKSPAGQYLIDQNVQPSDFNAFGARRGNHQVMVRGTFGNVRLRNQLAPDTEGDWTTHFPSGEKMCIYDASVLYHQEGVPLLVIGGKEYGTGSSRDWAAKGSHLLGVQAVLAESFERIHRGNLVGMGILPLQFKPGENALALGLTGKEIYDIVGVTNNLKPRQELTIRVITNSDHGRSFQAIARIDTTVEVDYYRNGGVLQTVLRRMIRETKVK
jgi:aconitate hydratase